MRNNLDILSEIIIGVINNKMSKKNKTRKVSLQGGDQSAVNISTEAPTLTTYNTKTSYTQTFNPDYSNVIRDLKHIGVLAGSFFVVLIVLSFFLH
jgi:hypothetical protein